MSSLRDCSMPRCVLMDAYLKETVINSDKVDYNQLSVNCI